MIKFAAMLLTAGTFLFGVEMLCDIPFTQVSVEAHSGRTDSNGGHKDNKNASGLGPYHYHCGGYPAHLHDNGVCPYATVAVQDATATVPATTPATTQTNDTTKTTTTKSAATKNKASKSDVKKVQKALNALGYDCGKPDGVCGKTTKKRIKEFQEDTGVTVDGIIDAELMKALGI